MKSQLSIFAGLVNLGGQGPLPGFQLLMLACMQIAKLSWATFLSQWPWPWPCEGQLPRFKRNYHWLLACMWSWRWRPSRSSFSIKTISFNLVWTTFKAQSAKIISTFKEDFWNNKLSVTFSWFLQTLEIYLALTSNNTQTIASSHGYHGTKLGMGTVHWAGSNCLDRIVRGPYFLNITLETLKLSMSTREWNSKKNQQNSFLWVPALCCLKLARVLKEKFNPKLLLKWTWVGFCFVLSQDSSHSEKVEYIVMT